MLDFSQIDPNVRAILTTASGIITRGDIIDHLHRKVREGVLDWPELFDARHVSIDLSLDDLQEIADSVKQVAGGQKLGDVGVVSDNAFISTLAKAYSSITGGQRQWIRVFEYLDDARDWVLKEQGTADVGALEEERESLGG